MSEPGPAPAPANPKRRFFPRFTLRTLTLCVLLFASSFGLWWKWEPWVVVLRLGGHSGPVEDASFSPDGSEVLTHSYGDQQAGFAPEKDHCEIATWDARTGKRKHFIRWGDAIGGNGASFSADGRWIVSWSWSYKGRTALFDAQTGKPLFPEMEGTSSQSCHLSVDSRKLLVWYSDRAAEVWDLNKRSRCCTIDGIDADKDAFRFTPDGSLIAAIGHTPSGDSVFVFDTATGRCIHRIEIPIRYFDISRDGRLLVGWVTFDDLNDERCKAWAKKVEEELMGPVINSEVTIAFCLDLATGELCIDMEDPPCYAEPVRGNKLLRVEEHRGARSSGFRFSTHVYDAPTKKRLWTLKGHVASTDSCLTLDGKRILTMSAWEGSDNYSPGGAIKSETPIDFWEWDADTGAEIAHVAIPDNSNNNVMDLRYLNGERRVVATTWNGTYCWDAGTGANLVSFECAGFSSPDGRRVLLWSPGDDLRIYDVEKSQVAGLAGSARALPPKFSFSPDGERLLLLLGGNADEAQVWERRREEGLSGILALPEFWLTTAFALLTLWSLARDFRTLRRANRSGASSV